MTEAEWLACGQPEDIVGYLSGSRGLVRTKAGRRKLRLYACACCRSVWDAIPDDAGHRAVEVTEVFADAAVTKVEHDKARETAHEAAQARWQTALDVASVAHGHSTTVMWRATRAAVLAADTQPGLAAGTAGPILAKDVCPFVGREGEKVRQIALTHDIFGNPFRPVALPDAYRTPAVLALARAAYDERALPSGHLDADRLAVLADALEDAGTTGDILAHLRSPGPHVRGCWALDVVLGKE